MPRYTRSSAANSPVKAAPTGKPTQTQQASPLTFILPKGAVHSSDARILSLENPADGAQRRYLFDPASGLYEFTKVSVPLIDPRSTLFAPNESVSAATGMDIATGYTSSKADVFVATLVDITFHMLPILYTSLAKSRRDTGKGLFLSLDDLLDGADLSSHLRYVVRNDAFQPTLAARLESICDTVDAGDENMFRLNEDKVLKLLIRKARRMVSKGLPKSMEENFVSRALESPVLSIKREASSATLGREESQMSVDTIDINESTESQSSSLSSAPSANLSEASSFTTADAAIDDSAPSGVHDLLRLRSAFSFLSASYLAPDFADVIEEKLATAESPIDFMPLDEHLKHLATLRAEAAASRSLGDFSRKRSNMEDEDAVEARADKKRRLEEEEKRKKAGVSRGVRDLKKADVSGMKKMSDFFGKKPSATKPKT